ncbi:MAG: hypothetical protein EPO27_14835 [Betaproteobacteria bacterium]|nr:MAG: hypothetical protein EPO27_14835 [Betaproteobacteria bacterium]
MFNYVRSRIDRTPRRRGQWILTDSQEAGLMRNVTESMAGRAAVLQLWPLSMRESAKVGSLRGSYAEVLARRRRHCGSAPICRRTSSATCGRSARRHAAG